MLTMPMRCPQCGKPFVIDLTKWKARRRYYCSPECKVVKRRVRERELVATRPSRVAVSLPAQPRDRPTGWRTWCPRCRWWWLKASDAVCPQCGAPRSPKYHPVVVELFIPEEVERLSAN